MATRAETRKRNRSSPLYEVIYDILREHIIDGSFPAGLVLGESLVARAFSASRVPAGAALKRLHREGLIRDFEGRGYLTGRSDAEPVRRELGDAGLRLPEAITGELKLRNRREHIYPDVEHTVAASLSYGRFLLNESALAEHYDVSRTVAHEVLTQLERIGLVTQDTNQRWYAGPLTADLLGEHYEMRWLLEPMALGQAIDELEPDEIRAIRDRAAKARSDDLPPERLEQLERDLHVDIVLRCRNGQLRETIRRNQLPIFATHSGFERLQNRREIDLMISEHLSILHRRPAARGHQAMHALEAHLRRSLGPNIELLRRLGPLPENLHRPYLVMVS